MINNLKALLEESSAIEARANEARRNLSEIVAKKDKAIAEATGPEDEKAIAKLNVLASQESICNSQLKISNREMEGVKLRVLNEAIHVRRAVMEVLTEARNRQIARLDSKLEEFYPDAYYRKKVVQGLTGGAGIAQAPYITDLGKHAYSLACMVFNHKATTEIKWAKQVLIDAKNAVALLEAKKSN